MNNKLRLLTLLLSFTPLTFAKADTAACIFDWAETAAPSLISSSVKTQNIPYGDFTLRYYDKTQNALIVNEKTKELLFYDVSKFLNKHKEIQVFSSQKMVDINIDASAWWYRENQEKIEIRIFIDGIEHSKIVIEKSDSLKNRYDLWGPVRNYHIAYETVSIPISIGIVSDDSIVDIKNIDVEGDNYISENDTVNSSESIVNYKKMSHFIDPNNDELTNLGNKVYWSTLSNCTKKNEPIELEKTSYLEAQNSKKPTIKLPSFEFSEELPPVAYELADLTQDGRYELIVATNAKSSGNLNLYNEDDIGKIYVFARDANDEKWVDVTEILLESDDACVVARKMIVADFNNDEIPDIVLSCHGHDFLPDDLLSGMVKGEKNKIILSNANGLYKVKNIEFKGPIGWKGYCYCHGASAGDINKDGNIDLVFTDNPYLETINGSQRFSMDTFSRPFILLGDGDGGFKLSDTLGDVFEGSWYSVELIDFNEDGHLDIWASGNLIGDDVGSMIVYSQAGEFYRNNISFLPNDGVHAAIDMVFHDGYIYEGVTNARYDSYKIWKIPLDASEFETVFSSPNTTRLCNPQWPMRWNQGPSYSIEPIIWWLRKIDNYLVPKENCNEHNFMLPLK